MIIVSLAAIEDFATKEISLWMPLSCGVVSAMQLILGMIKGDGGLMEALLSLIPGLVFIFLSFATRQDIGYGDGLMMLSFAPVLGLNRVCFCIVVALTISSVFSIILLMLRKGNRDTRISFIPMLAVGVGVTFLAQI